LWPGRIVRALIEIDAPAPQPSQLSGPASGGAMRGAERVCACCRTVERCHAWQRDGDGSDCPRPFCPNAELLDEVALAQRRTG
jgi:hypothetical protein